MSRFGALCGVVAMAALISGCPVVTPTACTDSSECDDGNGCTTDACTDGICVATEDCAADHCVNDACVECIADSECDDGTFCNGTETCAADGTCTTPTDPCADDGLFCTGTEGCDEAAGACTASGDPCDTAAGEVCNDDTDTCDIPCTADTDCDDSDLCTTDTCDADGICSFAAVDCSDGDLCTDDVCDATDGTCSNPAVVCDAGTACDPADGSCTATPCTVDTDCDDSVACTDDTCVASVCTFTDNCTGGNMCDSTSGTCVECVVDADCGTGFVCTANACVGTDDPVTFDLTFSGDSFTGGSGPDTFDGSLEVVGTTIFQTLNSSDSLAGGGGDDTLTAQLRGGGTTTPATLSSIETVNLTITDATASTISLLASSGITTLNNSASDAALTITNLPEALTTLGMSNSSSDFSVTILNSGSTTPLSGTSDTLAINLQGLTDAGTTPDITIQPSAAGSGYETWNINSTGFISNGVDQITQGNGNSLTTINVTGDKDLTIGVALDTTVTKLDASGATGGVSATIPGDGVAGTAITVTGGSGKDSLNCSDTADENFTVSGGAGDDTITFNANYDSTSPFSDIVDGGAGTDTLVVVSADATTTTSQTSATSFETLQVSDALAGNLDAAQYWGSGITKVTLAAGIDGTARTVTLPEGGTLDMNADAGAATHVLTVGGTGTADTATLDLASGVDFPNPLTVTGIEVLTIAGPTTAGTKNDFGNTVTMTASAGGSTKIVITGANEVELSGAVTAGIIDGSAATGVIDIQAAMAAAASITGGSGNDILTGSNSNDVISGGAGTDTIDGNDGDDVLTGGSGADTFQAATGDQSTTPSSSVFTTIKDFEKDSDIIDDTSAALTIVSGTTNAGVATASINSEGICSFNAADDTLQERIVACEDGIAENGTAAAGQFAVFEHGSDSYVFISDGTDTLGANDLLFKLEGVTGLTDTTIDGSNNITIK